MSFIAWNDRLSVGVEIIDSDHKKLVGMLNELYDAIADGTSKEILGDLLDRLVEYTSVHFAREESFFSRTGYPGAEAHKFEHANMIAWLVEMRTRLKSGSAMGPSLELVNYLKDWLFDHILGSDMEYGPHLNAMGIC